MHAHTPTHALPCMYRHTGCTPRAPGRTDSAALCQDPAALSLESKRADYEQCLTISSYIANHHQYTTVSMTTIYVTMATIHTKRVYTNCDFVLQFVTCLYTFPWQLSLFMATIAYSIMPLPLTPVTRATNFHKLLNINSSLFWRWLDWCILGLFGHSPSSVHRMDTIIILIYMYI